MELELELLLLDDENDELELLLESSSDCDELDDVLLVDWNSVELEEVDDVEANAVDSDDDDDDTDVLLVDWNSVDSLLLELFDDDDELDELDSSATVTVSALMAKRWPLVPVIVSLVSTCHLTLTV